MTSLLLQFVFIVLLVILPMALYRSFSPRRSRASFFCNASCPGALSMPRPANSTRRCLWSCCSFSIMSIRPDIPDSSARYCLPSYVPPCSPPGGRTDGSASCSTVRRHLSPAASSHWLYVSCRSCSPCPLPSHISFWQPCSIPPAEFWPNGRTGTGDFTCRNIRMRCPTSTIAIITRGCHDNADRSGLILSAQ